MVGPKETRILERVSLKSGSRLINPAHPTTLWASPVEPRPSSPLLAHGGAASEISPLLAGTLGYSDGTRSGVAGNVFVRGCPEGEVMAPDSFVVESEGRLIC